jgi:hypothetical protein
MDSKSKILGVIRARGPVTPMQMSKELKVESYMASALLSELVSEKKLKISGLKVGTSPLYYLPGQEDRLENFVGYLNEKDRRTYALLKEKGVIKDRLQDPLVRVSLRAIKDFAVPLEVSHDGRTEIFWKFYLLPPEKTELFVKEQLGVTEAKPEPAKEEFRPQPKPVVAEPKPEKAPTKPAKEKAMPAKDGFAAKVRDYFAKNEIVVLQENVLRKNEYAFIVKVPSAVGELDYYCYAVAKRKISGGDLAAAYVRGEDKKLPVLFLTTGELTKQARDMCAREFKNISVKKI